MKIAIVHDYIKEYGGAERVLEALHEIWPKAPVFTSLYAPNALGPHKERFANWDIRTSWFQAIPFASKLISPLRLLAPFAFQSLDFSKFDVVIVSATGAYNPNLINKKNALQICYCHTPPRYLYGYATARQWKKNIVFRVIGELANHILRMVDFKSSERVDYFIANSENIKKRIQKFYRKDAVVIYPPVAIQNQESRIKNQEKRTYYVAGGRLARPKHIDLIVQACQEQKFPLKVFGKGFAGYEKELFSSVIASSAKQSQGDPHGRVKRGSQDDNSHIQFVGEVTDEEKLTLMANAKAYLFASEDEDFGITPVEAMSVGTPVIAYRSGGVLETVIEGETGVFFDELNTENLVRAINKLNKLRIDPKNCTKQAEKFSKEQFMTQIKKFVEAKYNS